MHKMLYMLYNCYITYITVICPSLEHSFAYHYIFLFQIQFPRLFCPSAHPFLADLEYHSNAL